MSSSKRLKTPVLILGALTILFLIVAAIWTKSAELEKLSPLLTVGGNLHPLFLHLPIGIFVYLGFAETWNLLTGVLTRRGKIPGGLPMLAFGTVFAVLAAGAGLLLYLQGDYSGELINQHLNWGTGFAVSAVIVLCCALIFRERPFIYRLTLIGSVAVLWFAAHKGGLITHGDPLEPFFTEEAVVEEAQPIEELIAFTVVDKIFQEKCYNCHSVAKKQKGGLLMDSYEALLLGGDEGDALVPGDLELSKISSYAHLPLDDDLHMPPEGKPQLTEMEIQFMDQWILAGASPDARLSEQEFSEELYEWAIDYMQVEELTIQEAPAVIDIPELPVIDLATLIADIEQHAENSVSRIGPDGELLSFSAVNARAAFNDTAASDLSKIAPNLIDVDLSHTKITEQTVAALANEAPHLKSLNLSNTEIGDDSLAHLVTLDHLETLILFSTPLSEKALPHLTKLTQLDSLYLTQTGLDDGQVIQIREALPDTEVIADDYLNQHTAKPVAIEPEPLHP